MILHTAATAFTTVITAAFAWVETLAITAAFVACVVLAALGPLVAPTAKKGRRAAPPTPATRRVPSWAHTQPYDEAA